MQYDDTPALEPDVQPGVMPTATPPDAAAIAALEEELGAIEAELRALEPQEPAPTNQ